MGRPRLVTSDDFGKVEIQCERSDMVISVVLKMKSFSFISGQVITLLLLVDNRHVQNLRAFVLY